MAIKMTGAEFWHFYNDDTFWPEGAWHDDTVVRVNGETVDDYTSESMPGNAPVVIEGGVIFLEADGDKNVTFESHFRKWRKAQDTVSFVVECPTAMVDAVRAAIKAAGGKVI